MMLYFLCKAIVIGAGMLSDFHDWMIVIARAWVPTLENFKKPWNDTNDDSF